MTSEGVEGWWVVGVVFRKEESFCTFDKIGVRRIYSTKFLIGFYVLNELFLQWRFSKETFHWLLGLKGD